MCEDSCPFMSQKGVYTYHIAMRMKTQGPVGGTVELEVGWIRGITLVSVNRSRVLLSRLEVNPATPRENRSDII